MNFKLKALVAAATLVAAGSANAALIGADSGDGELFLNVVNTVTKDSLVFDLSNIGGNDFSVHSFEQGSAATAQNYTWANSAVASFISAASGNIKWNVVAADNVVDYDGGFDNTTPNQEVAVSTINALVNVNTLTVQLPILDNMTARDSLINSNVNSASSDADPVVTFGGTSGKQFAFAFGDTWGQTAFVDSTNALGVSAKFVKITGNSDATPSGTSVTTFLGAFKLDAAGVLTYTVPVAAVPESDTYAMLLAGLGVMGFVARRRMAA